MMTQQQQHQWQRQRRGDRRCGWVFNSRSTLILIILLLSPTKKKTTKKEDGIGNTFKNTDPVLRQNNSNKDDYDGDDDDPWVLTDGKYWFYILFFS